MRLVQNLGQVTNVGLYRVLSKIRTAVTLIRTINNWPTYYVVESKLLQPKRIMYKLRNGIWIQARPHTMDKAILKDIWIRRVYNPEGFGIQETDTVLDVGAHIGIFTLFAARAARKGKVYALEPAPENFRLARLNMELNGANNVIGSNVAMSNETGKKEFFLSGQNSGGHSFHPLEPHQTQTLMVDTISLEDFMEGNNISQIDFLKMDCEGEEYEIILEAPKDFLDRVLKLSMECHHIDGRRNPATLMAFLEGSGFQVALQESSRWTSMLYARR